MSPRDAVATPLQDTLRLRPGITVLPGGREDPAVTWVTLNTRVLRLRGEGIRCILAAIDGVRTLGEISLAVGAADSAEVVAAVDRLRRAGLLEPEMRGTPARLAPQVRAFTDLGADGAAVTAELAWGRVGVLGDGVLAGAVGTALERAGVDDVVAFSAPPPGAGAPAAELEGVDLVVAAPGRADPAALGALNALAIRDGIPWILVQAHAWELRVGPFFLPVQTPCWTCYERRLEANEPAHEERGAVREALRRAGAVPAGPDDMAPGTAVMAAELCALEVVRFFAARVSDVTPELYGSFADYSLLAHRAAPHRVLKLPRCPSCGARAMGRPTVRAWMEPYGYPDG